jgi:hypothetical protein
MSYQVNAYTLVAGANVPSGYLSAENVKFVQEKAGRVLSEYRQTILFDVASVKRVMVRVLEERRDTVPKMNERAVMSLAAEFRRHQQQVEKHLGWEETYRHDASQLVDGEAGSSQFDWTKKIHPRGGGFVSRPAVGGTVRFYYT